MMRRTLFILLLIAGTISVPAQKNKYQSTLSSADMLQDVNYLQRMLEATAPGLYAHQSPERVKFLFDSVKTTLHQPLPFPEFYKKIAFMIAEVHCEHSSSLPGKGQITDLMPDAALFPFQPEFSGPLPIVIINGTRDTTIKPGDEIISINGKKIDSILQAMYRYMPGDGFITSSKAAALSGMVFSFFYNMFIERSTAYDVLFKTRSGQMIEQHFDQQLNMGDINRNALKNPVNQPILAVAKKIQARRKADFKLEFTPDNQNAFLTVRTFSTDEEKFRHIIDSFFLQLKQTPVRNLVIDLSYNGGGEEALGAYLLSYLVDKPTRLVESEYLLTDKDEYLAMSNVPEDVLKNKYNFIEPFRDGKSMVRPSFYARELDIIEPKANRFTGRLYLYVNAMTASAASTFSAIVQSNKLGTIVGEETGGSYKGGGVTIGIDLTLPRSGIKTHTSLAFMNFATGKDKDGSRGVIPDLRHRPGFDELMEGEGIGWRKYVMSLF